MIGKKTSENKKKNLPSAIDGSLMGSKFMCIIWLQDVAFELEHWNHLAFLFIYLPLRYKTSREFQGFRTCWMSPKVIRNR